MANKVNVTNSQLMRWHDELKQLSQVGSIFYQFNRAKVKQFYSDNSIRIDSVFKKINTIRTKYFLLDKDGTLVMEGDEGKEKTPVFLPDMKKEDYDKEMADLMDAEVSVTI